jgi:quinol monooxygenase YgiN
MHIAEFTLHAKPGHFQEVADIYSAFAAEFLSNHPALETVLIVGDESDGVVRGIGVFSDREAADAVNSDPQFADFNDTVAPLLASPSERAELQLLHHWVRST